jgi:hypothetical protein
MSLGAMMAGGNPASGERQDNDFYATPDPVTVALLKVLQLPGITHECCCGNGAMAKVLEAAGCKVVASDLVDRGYGKQRDFFSITRPVAHNLITNPPFNLAEKMIRHGLSLRPNVMAFVLKSTFWHAKGRYPLFVETKPAMILPLTWRPDFLNLGRPTMEVMWCVWKKGHAGPPIYQPLIKPE